MKLPTACETTLFVFVDFTLKAFQHIKYVAKTSIGQYLSSQSRSFTTAAQQQQNIIFIKFIGNFTCKTRIARE